MTHMTPTGMRKVCARCKVDKGESEYPGKTRHGVLPSWCSECLAAYNREKWAASPEFREASVSRQRVRRAKDPHAARMYRRVLANSKRLEKLRAAHLADNADNMPARDWCVVVERDIAV